MTKKIVKLSKGQIVNANTELIPEAPNRQAIYLTAVEPARIAIVEFHDATPSTVCIVLRRTPPATVDANEVVIIIVVADPARKRRK